MQSQQSAQFWAKIAHSTSTKGYLGPVSVFKTGAIGLVFGFAFLAVGRNIWLLIIAHSLIDSIDMVTHYFGG